MEPRFFDLKDGNVSFVFPFSPTLAASAGQHTSRVGFSVRTTLVYSSIPQLRSVGMAGFMHHTEYIPLVRPSAVHSVGIAAQRVCRTSAEIP